MEGPIIDEKLGLVRIRGKSFRDGMEGWITVRGNHGTIYLQEIEKPYYACNVDVTLETTFQNAEPLRALRPEEVIELVLGPKKEEFPNGHRMRGRACSDGAEDWLTIKDWTGVMLADRKSRYYVCCTSVAMTDAKDVRDCEVVQKLSEDDVFLVLEGPDVDHEVGVTRVRGRTIHDRREGWITVKGNAGTVYADESRKHYTVLAPCGLHQELSSGSTLVRSLVTDDVIELLEGPTEERFDPVVRILGRVLGDDVVGWVTLRSDNLRAWTPFYRCLRPVQITENGAVIRELSVGETVELSEGPFASEDSKVVRLRGRAELDGVTGWVPITDVEGKKNLEA